MKKYCIDVKYVGYTTVMVEAIDSNDAHNKAVDKFEDMYMNDPLHSLSYVSISTDNLNDPDD